MSVFKDENKKRSVREFVEAVETRYRDAPLAVYGKRRKGPKEDDSFNTRVEAYNKFKETEGYEILVRFCTSPRDLDIFVSWVVYGKEPMGSIGIRHGVSGTRVRQLANRTHRRLRVYAGMPQKQRQGD